MWASRKRRSGARSHVWDTLSPELKWLKQLGSPSVCSEILVSFPSAWHAERREHQAWLLVLLNMCMWCLLVPVPPAVLREPWGLQMHDAEDESQWEVRKCCEEGCTEALREQCPGEFCGHQDIVKECRPSHNYPWALNSPLNILPHTCFWTCSVHSSFARTSLFSERFLTRPVWFQGSCLATGWQKCWLY